MEFTLYEILYFDQILDILRSYLKEGDKYIGLVALAYKVKVRI